MSSLEKMIENLPIMPEISAEQEIKNRAGTFVSILNGVPEKDKAQVVRGCFADAVTMGVAAEVKVFFEYPQTSMYLNQEIINSTKTNSIEIRNLLNLKLNEMANKAKGL